MTKLLGTRLKSAQAILFWGMLAAALFCAANSIMLAQQGKQEMSCETEYSTSFDGDRNASNQSWYKFAPFKGDPDLFNYKDHRNAKLAVTGGAAISEAPWIVDKNHAGLDPKIYGAGLIQVIAVAWLEGSFGSHEQTDEHMDAGKGIMGRCADLSHVKVAYDVQSSHLDLNGASLRFWFQTTIHLNDKRIFSVNYAFRKILETKAGQHSVPLTSNIEDWICLGARDQDDSFPQHSDRGYYGCAADQAEFTKAISRVDDDFGFILLLEPYSFMGHSPMRVLPGGRIAFSKIQLTKR